MIFSWINTRQTLCVMGAAVLSAVILAAIFFETRALGAGRSRPPYVDPSQIPSSPRPHIVFILADDMGWNDVGFHGSDQIPTPNIDALAFDGVILNRHYVQPVCTPSRAALMTGKYPIHTGMQGMPLYATERRGLPLDEKLLAQYLKDLGYATHIVGKWHLGYYNLDFTPLRRGFDSHIGYWNGAISYYDHVMQEVGSASFNGHDFRRNYTTAWEYQGKYATDIFTEEAENTISSHDPSSPLFLYLPHLAVHAGNEGKWLEAPQEDIDELRFIKDPNRRTYAAMVKKLDDSIGRVVSALEKKKMLHNSIIVFMSDNGAPISDFFKNYGSNLPFRGEKATLWEGSVRTPALVWSPHIHASSRVSQQLMHISDWLPTLITAAGGDTEVLPKNTDGIDMWSTLSSDLPSPREELVVNIDLVNNYGSIIIEDNATTNGGIYKLVVGSQKGDRGEFYPLNDVALSPKYSPDNVLSSPAYSAVRQAQEIHSILYANSTVTKQLNSSTIVKLRSEATITCTPAKNVSLCTDRCLFNLQNDPCEQTNLADNNDFVQVMSTIMDSYNRAVKTVVPQLPKILDPRANPALFNYTWSAWVTSK